jgi:hypothetical protein
VRPGVTWAEGYAGTDLVSATWASVHGASPDRALPTSVGFGRASGWGRLCKHHVVSAAWCDGADVVREARFRSR